MTAPDPVVAVIAEALRQHAWFNESRCACGRDDFDYDPEPHFVHQAQAVAAAVREAGLAAPEGLTEELAFKYTHLASGRHTIIETTSEDVDTARRIAGDTHELTAVRRLVTPWAVVAEGEQP